MSLNSKKIYLLGCSGHAYVVAHSAINLGIKIQGYLDKSQSDENPLSLDYFGSEDDDGFVGWNETSAFILGIGNNKIRTIAARKLRERGKQCIGVVDSSALIANKVNVGDGTFISRGAIVNGLTTIGQDAIINTGAIVEHECQIDSGVHIAPGAVLLGNVKVGENSFVGANSVIKQGVEIGNNVIIGAGSVVVENIASGLKVVGNPAKRFLV